MTQPRNSPSVARAGLIVSMERRNSFRRLPEGYARVTVDSIVQDPEIGTNWQSFVFGRFGDKERVGCKPLPFGEARERRGNHLLAIGRVEEHQIERSATADRHGPEPGGIPSPDLARTGQLQC